MKVQSSHYKGIEFVRFQDLPEDQQALLRLNTEVERINILIDGRISSNCIQFKDYSAWYISVFRKSVAIVGGVSRPIRVTEVSLDQV
jgi:hypothetical protein